MLAGWPQPGITVTAHDVFRRSPGGATRGSTFRPSGVGMGLAFVDQNGHRLDQQIPDSAAHGSWGRVTSTLQSGFFLFRRSARKILSHTSRKHVVAARRSPPRRPKPAGKTAGCVFRSPRDANWGRPVDDRQTTASITQGSPLSRDGLIERAGETDKGRNSLFSHVGRRQRCGAGSTAPQRQRSLLLFGRQGRGGGCHLPTPGESAWGSIVSSHCEHAIDDGPQRRSFRKRARRTATMRKGPGKRGGRRSAKIPPAMIRLGPAALVDLFGTRFGGGAQRLSQTSPASTRQNKDQKKAPGRRPKGGAHVPAGRTGEGRLSLASIDHFRPAPKGHVRPVSHPAGARSARMVWCSCCFDRSWM